MSIGRSSKSIQSIPQAVWSADANAKVRTQRESSVKQENIQDLSKFKFANEIKVDFVKGARMRIMCRFLGMDCDTDIKRIEHDPPLRTYLTSLMMMQTLNDFMESIDYSYAGELDFDDQEDSMPCIIKSWRIKDQEYSFVTRGFIYFEHPSGNREDNIVFEVHAAEHISITCYSKSLNDSKNMILDLESYAKKNNCIRGAKLKGINVHGSALAEVDVKKDANWENYYYPDNLIDVVEEEVFEFLKNPEKYNDIGIHGRGCMFQGPPGSGKTTLGHIICNNLPDQTVVWITPEVIAEAGSGGMMGIKAMYGVLEFLSPCVIMLEDLDLFSTDRETSGNMLSLGALMNILDGINSVKNVVTIGTTNRIDVIESALRNRPGRFDRIIEVPNLNDDLRERMFKKQLKDWKNIDKLVNYIVGRTEGWSGAMAHEFVKNLEMKNMNNASVKRNLTKKIIEEVLSKMNAFGIGELAKSMGFTGEG